jgi:hypothetical protein
MNKRRGLFIVLMIAMAATLASPDNCTGIVFAEQWDKKPPAAWSRGEVVRLLTDSPWARTHKITTVVDRAEQSSINPTPTVRRHDLDLTPGEIRFRIRLISAKPVREALGRYPDQIEDERERFEIRDLVDLLQSEDHSDLVIVMVSCDTAVPNSQFEDIQAALETGETDKLKKESSIEIPGKPGAKLIELQEYKSWGRRSGLFKFPRALDGKPWLTPDTPEFRFRTRLGKTTPVVATFKPKDMLFDGALEY